MTRSRRRPPGPPDDGYGAPWRPLLGGRDAVALHVRDELPRDLGEDVLGEGVLRRGPETAELAERHELHHVAGGNLAREGGGEPDPVAVEVLHRREVALAHAHDDDRQRRVGRVDDGGDGRVLYGGWGAEVQGGERGTERQEQAMMTN